MDTPLSQSSVSLELSEIQKRCQEFMEQELSELRLEDSDTPLASAGNSYNPYDRSR